MDVDSFKSINDSRGHRVGDEVLKKLVDILQRMLRSTDVIARYGGDEFVILLPETNLSVCREIASRLSSQIAQSSLMLNDGGNIAFSVSMGVAEFDAEKGQSLDQLLEMADHAMYKAKTCGRNQVCAAEFETQ
jgi:diguanylate cyclase (GGDEF)-like protein